MSTPSMEQFVLNLTAYGPAGPAGPAGDPSVLLTSANTWTDTQSFLGFTVNGLSFYGPFSTFTYTGSSADTHRTALGAAAAVHTHVSDDITDATDNAESGKIAKYTSTSGLFSLGLELYNGTSTTDLTPENGSANYTITVPASDGTMALTSDLDNISFADLDDLPNSLDGYGITDAAAAVHASTHATGGSDPITPASIGAETPTQTDAKIAAAVALKGDMPTAGRYVAAKIVNAESTPAINMVILGDSEAAIIGSTLGNILKMQMGFCGHGLGSLTATAASGATVGDDRAVWVTGTHYVLPTAGTVTFFNLETGTGENQSVVADEVKVAYIKESGAGTFKLQTSLNNGSSWVDVGSTIDASNGTTIGAVNTVALTHGTYQFRVVGVSGTVKIIGIATQNIRSVADVPYTQGGVIVHSFARGGDVLATQLTVSTDILNPIVSAIDPDFAFYCGDETLDSVTASIDTWRTRLVTAKGSGMDFLWSQCPPQSSPVSQANVIAAGEWLKDYAATQGDSYFQTQTITGDYATFNAAGLSTDGVHPTTSGAYFIAGQIAKFLGWFDLLAHGTAPDYNYRKSTFLRGVSGVSLPTTSSNRSRTSRWDIVSQDAGSQQINFRHPTKTNANSLTFNSADSFTINSKGYNKFSMIPGVNAHLFVFGNNGSSATAPTSPGNNFATFVSPYFLYTVGKFVQQASATNPHLYKIIEAVDGTTERFSVRNNGFVIAPFIPTYADDAAADTDTTLVSGGLYRTTGGGRAVYWKP
jgi:hypothetical protein